MRCVSASVSCVSELCQCGRDVRRQREDACRQRSGSAQTTFRKCADNVQERDSEGQAEDVRLRAGGLTAIERRLRGERIYADSGRMHADNIQEVRRQR